MPEGKRFPLLIKLLDAREKLSLQVHPPQRVAEKLGGEPKTEYWYVAAADRGAQLFVGFAKQLNRDQFKSAIDNGTVAECVHAIDVEAGDGMFLPAGRFHAIGAGNVLVEVQQNSDTTYRVFDWNRVDEATGKPRELHVDEALESVDFDDVAPKLIDSTRELLVADDLFEIQKWKLDKPREAGPLGQFAIVCCLTGSVTCAGVDLTPGEFFLVPASLKDRQIHPRADPATLLRVTIPQL